MPKFSSIVRMSSGAPPISTAALILRLWPGAGDGDPQVARQGEQLGTPLLRVDPQDHDRVGLARTGTPDAHRVVRVEALGALDADDQIVLGPTRVGCLVEDAAQLDTGQPLVLAVDVAEAGGAGTQCQGGQAAQHDDEALAPGPMPPVAHVRGSSAHGDAAHRPHRIPRPASPRADPTCGSAGWRPRAGHSGTAGAAPSRAGGAGPRTAPRSAGPARGRGPPRWPPCRSCRTGRGGAGGR